jgi:hypothetical protein
MRAAVALALSLIAGAAVAQPDARSGPQSGSGTTHMTVSKRAELAFQPGNASIPVVVRPRLRQLAAELKAALRRAPGTVEIEAYAPTPRARIVAVQRAADLRLALVEYGVPAESINVRVRPRGGNADTVTIWLRRQR